jgi:hypothetical protein
MIPACLLAGTMSAAGAESLHVRYSVKLIGLPLGTASLAGTIEPASYEIKANAKLTGIAAMVSSSRGAASSSGIISQGRIAPNAYATTSANSKETRTVRVAMTAGNVRAAEITPPFQILPGHVPVTEANKHNIIDPLSALLMPVNGHEPVVGPAACDRTLPIFDGWARFDVKLAYVGVRHVQTHGYEGPVAVCAARYTPIAGHRANRPGTKFMAENKNMEVWLAPVGDSRVAVPFRISVLTQIGTVVIEAQEFKATQTADAALHRN